MHLFNQIVTKSWFQKGNQDISQATENAAEKFNYDNF